MELPIDCYLKEISARYNQDTISRELRRGARLDPELWAKLVVEEGSVSLTVGKSGKETVSGASPRVIPRGESFSINPDSETCIFHLEYYHEPRILDGESLVAMMGR